MKLERVQELQASKREQSGRACASLWLTSTCFKILSSLRQSSWATTPTTRNVARQRGGEDLNPMKWWYGRHQNAGKQANHGCKSRKTCSIANGNTVYMDQGRDGEVECSPELQGPIPNAVTAYSRSIFVLEDPSYYSSRSSKHQDLGALSSNAQCCYEVPPMLKWAVDSHCSCGQP